MHVLHFLSGKKYTKILCCLRINYVLLGAGILEILLIEAIVNWFLLAQLKKLQIYRRQLTNFTVYTSYLNTSVLFSLSQF